VKHANNAVENDHERLKARLRPMRGLKRTAMVKSFSVSRSAPQTPGRRTAVLPSSRRSLVEVVGGRARRDRRTSTADVR
jgi:transposase-like protein